MHMTNATARTADEDGDLIAPTTLRALRLRAGLTLEQVAAEARVGTAYLSRVETGKAIASGPWLGMVATVIGRHLVGDQELPPAS